MRHGAFIVVLVTAVSACGARTPLDLFDHPNDDVLQPQTDTTTTRGRLFARGNQEVLELSDDGVSWREVQGFDSDGVGAIAKDDSGNVVLFDKTGRSFASDDLGDHWTRGTIPVTGYLFHGVVWDGAQFVAIGDLTPPSDKSTRETVVVSSPDGLTWTKVLDLADANTGWIFRTPGGARLVSWMTVEHAYASFDPTGRRISGAGFLNDKVNDQLSADYLPALGTTFLLRAEGADPSVSEVWSTTDGDTWVKHRRTSALDNAWHLVGAGDRVAVLTTAGATLSTSKDGDTWTSQHVDGIDYGRNLAYGGGRFHILGDRKDELNLRFETMSAHGWTTEPTHGIQLAYSYLWAGK